MGELQARLRRALTTARSPYRLWLELLTAYGLASIDRPVQVEGRCVVVGELVLVRHGGVWRAVGEKLSTEGVCERLCGDR